MDQDQGVPIFDGEMFRETLSEIARYRMPFGKYGPANYPPSGVPLYDLPAEYLSWFKAKGGFPKGRLGELMEIVHALKVDGSDTVFDPIRRKAGGRTVLRPQRKKDFRFGD